MSSLIINPEVGHEEGPAEALWYISPYFSQIRDVVAARGKDYTYLYKEQCIKDQVWNALQQKRTAVIAATGHGNASVYTGYQLEPIFWVDMVNEGYDPQLTQNTIMLMLSCLTAQRLGPYMISKGAVYYLGWSVEYVAYVDYGVRKEENSIDQLFFKPIEVGFSRVAVGDMTPIECKNYIAKKYTEYAPLLAPHERAALLSDRDNMVLLPAQPSILISQVGYGSLGLALGLGLMHILNPPGQAPK